MATVSYVTMLSDVINSTIADGIAMSTERVKTVSSYLPILMMQIVMGCIAIVLNSLLVVLSVFILGRVNNSLPYLICNLAVANVMLGIALST